MPKKRSVEDEERYQKARAYRLWTTYGITMEEYDALKEAQGGVCYICQRAKGIASPLQVDHDHNMEDQGKASIRGLLCGRCNNRVGWAEANWERLHSFITTPPARQVLGGHLNSRQSSDCR